MKNSFTTDDLLRFIYRETTPEEDQAIKNWIVENPDVVEQFQEFIDVVHMLDEVDLEPSDTSLNIILEFSEELAGAKSKT